MEHMVASRRLRKSALKEMGNSEIPSLAGIHSNYDFCSLNHESEEENERKEKSILQKAKNKIWIKIFLSVIIVLVCLIGKLAFYDNLKNNQWVGILVKEYKKDYQKEDIVEKVENFFRQNKKTIAYIVPEQISNSVKNIYYEKVKEKYLNFNVKNFYDQITHANNHMKEASVYVYNKVDVVENIEETEKIPTEEKMEPSTENISPVSAVSSMESDINLIQEKKISMIAPVSGTITSTYGAREEILSGVGTFHTGVDIANVLNTEIKSATQGRVTEIGENNKYWGNYIVITTSDVSFRYAHLNKIEVGLNQEVEQGQIIGKMGSTGYSTGSHLHFQISIDSRTVDPQKLVDIR